MAILLVAKSGLDVARTDTRALRREIGKSCPRLCQIAEARGGDLHVDA
jgi:hypothetical protein